MNIGIDIDDTINNLAEILKIYAVKYNKENNIDYKMNFNYWEWDKACGWDEYHIHNFLSTYIEELYTKATIKEGAKEAINKLKDEGNSIIIITSRSDKHFKDPYGISERWLKKHGICYDKLIVNGYEKARTMQKKQYRCIYR